MSSENGCFSGKCAMLLKQEPILILPWLWIVPKFPTPSLFFTKNPSSPALQSKFADSKEERISIPYDWIKQSSALILRAVTVPDVETSRTIVATSFESPVFVPKILPVVSISRLKSWGIKA